MKALSGKNKGQISKKSYPPNHLKRFIHRNPEIPDDIDSEYGSDNEDSVPASQDSAIGSQESVPENPSPISSDVRRLFPEVKLSVCTHEIQNFGNSTADISILGIPEEVKEYTDWVHSNIFVEKALEGELYYTHSTGEITTEFPNRERVEHAGHFPTPMEMCMDDHLTQTTERTQQQQSKTACSAVQHTTFFQTLLPDMLNSHQAWKIHQFFQGTSSCKEKRKIWIQVHSH